MDITESQNSYEDAQTYVTNIIEGTDTTIGTYDEKSNLKFSTN